MKGIYIPQQGRKTGKSKEYRTPCSPFAQRSGGSVLFCGIPSLLKEYSVVQSMSRVGTLRDNAVMENFFARFKIVLRSHFRYWLRDDLSAVIAQTIYYFNYLRPMRFLGKKPPVPFRLEQTA